MNKETLSTFIKKYNLNDLVTKTKWKYNATEKTLHTRATADNKAFILDVVMNDFTEFGAEDVIICIGDTKKVKSMMTPFSEEISLSVNKQGDRVLGFSMVDSDIEVYCNAADPTAIDPVPKTIQEMPDYQVEVPLTEELVEKFLKSRTALEDVENFTVSINKKGAFEFVFGYTTSNSNRIRITPQTNTGKDKLVAALTFPLNNIYQVLKANNEMPDGLLSINDMGIIRLFFKNEKYTCTYYQFANKKA